MLAHFASVAAALVIAFWSTTVDRYYEFRGLPPPERPSYSSEREAPVADAGSSPSSPIIVPESPFEVILDEVFRAATTAPAEEDDEPAPLPRGPVAPSTPSVPFTPLPVPVAPPITPTLPEPVTPTVPSVPSEPAVDPRIAGEALLKAAVVNIICLPGGGLRGASGSGVIVDPRGIIVTVAHVGQNFLLRDYPTKGAGTCYIRTGSPAKNAYLAEPIYISTDWIKENPGTFLSARPTGTGENDFAFFAITKSATSAPLPSYFAYLPLSSAGTEIDEGDEVGTGSYAAEFLTSSEVRSSLYPTIKFAEVDDVYTFGRNTVDIFSVAAGSAAQEGSSGGAVMSDSNRLLGLITTRTAKADLSLRTLQALTMDHLRRSFRADTGENLDAYLKTDLSTLVANYQDDAGELLDVLREAIDDVR